MISFEKHRSDKLEYLYNQRDNDLNFHKHTHRSFEAMFVFDGKIKCEIDGQIFELCKNQAALILPGQIHSYITESYCKSYLCVFSNDWVHEFYDEVRGSRFLNPVFNFGDTRICDILQNEESDRFLIRSALYEICSRVYSSSSLIRSNEAGFALINSLAFYVQENYRNDISLKKIAGEFGYNYSYLSSFFNENFGMNFSAYVNGYRVQSAMEYLINSCKDITEISVLCGFGTIRNFNRIFKRECGLSPSEYRAQAIKG